MIQVFFKFPANNKKIIQLFKLCILQQFKVLRYYVDAKNIAVDKKNDRTLPLEKTFYIKLIRKIYCEFAWFCTEILSIAAASWFRN